MSRVITRHETNCILGSIREDLKTDLKRDPTDAEYKEELVKALTEYEVDPKQMRRILEQRFGKGDQNGGKMASRKGVRSGRGVQLH